MNTPTHWNIAKLSVRNMGKLYPEYKMGRISKLLFYLGNIEPDLSWMHIVHPHYYEKSADYLYSKILRMNQKNKWTAAFSLGRQAHYLCDFCCFAHTGEKNGTIFEHIAYEYMVSRYLKENYDRFDQTEFKIRKYSDIILYMDKIIKQSRGTKDNYQIDIEKSIEISSALAFNALSGVCAAAFNSYIIHNQMAAAG